jgi:isoleucyl-tRNA synthetase
VLAADECSTKLVAAELRYTAALPDGSGLVMLDGTVIPEPDAHGLATDGIRELQELRRDSGFDVSDRIRHRDDGVRGPCRLGGYSLCPDGA